MKMLRPALLAATAAVLLAGCASVTAPSRVARPVPPTDCTAWVGTDRNAELPGYRLPQSDGRTPDAQLTDGLRLIDAELARMTDQLAGGTLDAVTVQGRYLELKYGDGGPG